MKLEKVKTKFGEEFLVNKKTAKLFEQEQKEWGTQIALGNLMWSIGAKFMGYAGVKTIHTTYKTK